ncbi:kinase-like protein [Rhizoclosmatium globosum]|uniref:Kinase-like protein n=1 Tax=Rhizoclosmatium globosum TaxID=329046 RepID=A0A1Y2CVB1_9FUNG|nr:kinase-like protein [Rhizoclosmatium globosum]|eukprot:ORY50999.1 kinase-like protein [Rhizoclosmatium globosum]
MAQVGTHSAHLPTRRNPITRLTVQIEATFDGINQAQLRSKQVEDAKKKLQNPWDDDKNDYIFREAEVWQDRFKIMRRLGKGSFGQVFEAYDMRSDKSVAIKIIKNRRSFYNQALTEIRILELLNERDFDDSKSIVRMKEHFIHRDHLCIVYELLSVNLYEVIKAGSFSGLTLDIIRKIAYHILQGLQLLSRSDVRVIHCDLKPENILLCHPKKAAVKVIDFGSSCFINERAYTYIQSRFYRSPEVILGHSYTMAIDVWSLGCILYELFSGEPLFSGQTEHDQLLKIMDLIGLPPHSMLETAAPQKVSTMFLKSGSPPNQKGNSTTSTYRPIVPPTFQTRGTTLYELLQTKFQRFVQLGKHLSPNGTSTQVGPTGNKANLPDHALKAYSSCAAEFELFRDLVMRMLVYVPEERITPDEALDHPFFTAPRTAEKEVNTTATMKNHGTLDSRTGRTTRSGHLGRGGLVGSGGV